MKDKIKIESITNLEKIKVEIISSGEKINSKENKICLFDTFCIAQLNRSLNLLDAFVILASMDNYIVAMAIVRLHLDTLLRLYAVRLTQRDINQVVEEILNGKSINNLDDGNGNKFSDFYLKTEISKIENYAWIKQAYETSSGFIHFSDSILKASNLGDPSKSTLNHSIKVGSDFINDYDKEVACKLMIKITEEILGHINKWIEKGKI